MTAQKAVTKSFADEISAIDPSLGLRFADALRNVTDRYNGSRKGAVRYLNLAALLLAMRVHVAQMYRARFTTVNSGSLGISIARFASNRDDFGNPIVEGADFYLPPFGNPVPSWYSMVCHVQQAIRKGNVPVPFVQFVAAMTGLPLELVTRMVTEDESLSQAFYAENK